MEEYNRYNKGNERGSKCQASPVPWEGWRSALEEDDAQRSALFRAPPFFPVIPCPPRKVGKDVSKGKKEIRMTMRKNVLFFCVCVFFAVLIELIELASWEE